MKMKYNEFFYKLAFVLYIFFVYSNRTIEYISFTSIISYLIIAGAGNILLIKAIKSNRLTRLDAILLLIFFAGSLTKIILFGNLVEGKTLFLLTSNLGIAKYLHSNINDRKLMKNVAIFLCVILLIYVQSMVSGQNAKLLFDAYSKNHIYVNVLFAISLLLLILNHSNYRPYINISLAILGMAVAVWTQSRSGIIAAIVMLVLFSAYSLKYMKFKFRLVYILALTIFCTQILKNGQIIDSALEVFYRKSFSGDVRFSMVDYYIDNLNLISFLAGSKNDSLFNSFGIFNLHNSFLSIHANMGLYGIVLMLIYGVTLIKAYLKNNVIFVVLIAIFLRAWSDTILMYYFDFVILFAVIDVNMKVRKKHPPGCERYKMKELR